MPVTNADWHAADVARRNGGRLLLPPPNMPMDVGRRFLAARHTGTADVPILRHWRAGWWCWHTSHWAETEERAIRAEVYGFTEHASYEDGGTLKSWAPTKRKVADVLEALAAICHLSDSLDQPAWIDKVVRDVRGPSHSGPTRAQGPIVACANGLLDLQTRTLLDHDPDYFNQTAVPFAYDPVAPPPSRWLTFLHELWSDDDSISALQEWFGYTVSGRTDLHKILLIVGPTRGGKGVISRLLGGLVGRTNVAGPTISSLRSDFGLQPLIGKPLAIVSDARLSGQDSNVVVERLLSISGEDWITVNRKFRDQWSGKLPSRFVVCSNELPRLGDASGAIAGRFLTLLLEKSWLGNEDSELEEALERELPGVLNWALDGLTRLEEYGRFTVPASTEQAFVALQDLASPVHAFIRDCCRKGPDQEVAVDELWEAWKAWAEENGHGKGGTRQVFGRNLRAALPSVGQRRPSNGGKGRVRCYRGIALRSTVDGTADIADHADEPESGGLW